MISKYIYKFNEDIIFFLISTSIFFSHVVFYGFQLRFAYLFIILFLIKDFLKTNKKKLIKFYISFFISIIIFFHSLYNYYLIFDPNDEIFNNKNKFILKIFIQSLVIFLTILILSNLKRKILLNFEKLVLYFLTFFFISLLIYQIYVGDIFGLLYTCNVGFFSLTQYIFLENSHFHIIAVPTIFYVILKFSEIKYKFLFFILTTLLIFFSFGLFSLTFFLSINIGCLSIFLFCRKLNKSTIIILLLLLFTNNVYFLNKDSCEAIERDYFDGTISSPKDKLLDVIEIDNFIKKEKNSINFSMKIYLNSYEFAAKSLKENILGSGISNYFYHFMKYKKNIIISKDFSHGNFLELNQTDGSTNFSKIVVEFGLFGLLLIIYLFLKFFTISLNDPLKIFLYLSIGIQIFIRGNGYFYNGFLIMIILLSLIILDEKNDN